MKNGFYCLKIINLQFFSLLKVRPLGRKRFKKESKVGDNTKWITDSQNVFSYSNIFDLRKVGFFELLALKVLNISEPSFLGLVSILSNICLRCYGNWVLVITCIELSQDQELRDSTPSPRIFIVCNKVQGVFIAMNGTEGHSTKFIKEVFQKE